MTEQEWMTSSQPLRMLQFLRGDIKGYTGILPLSDRKCRMFGCACVLHSSPPSPEKFAEGYEKHGAGRSDQSWAFAWADLNSSRSDIPNADTRCAILRDLFGPVFQPYQGSITVSDEDPPRLVRCNGITPIKLPMRRPGIIEGWDLTRRRIRSACGKRSHH